MDDWSHAGSHVRVSTSSGTVHGRLLVGADGLHSRIRRRAYVTPVGPRTVGVAVLFTHLSPAADGPGDSAETYGGLLGRFPALRERLGGAAALDRPRGAGPLRQRVRRRTGDGVVLVGDAAGYVDALTGQGIELGFAAAEALVDVIAAGDPLDRYETEYRRLTRRYRVCSTGS